MRHKVADVDGPVHYIDFGGSGPPVVMVHGLAGSAVNWIAVGPEIARTHHALALDLAGFGQTPLLARSATVGANATLVHDFVEQVVGEPVTLIGNSMGGHISILVAAQHPDAVSAMVLADPAIPGSHVRRPEPAMLGVIAALSVPGLALTLVDRQSRQLGPEGLVERALALVSADSSRLDPAVVEAHIQLTRERAHLGRQNARAFIQASRSIGLRMADPRFWSRVAAVRCPTLVVHGSLDRLIPVAAAQEMVRRRPDWELVVLDGVGHVPMLEVPGQFMQTLRAWSPYRIAFAPAAAS
ncbi:MAG TPA: alpha/beta fold hydrolase [Candidatus Limnocylindrales bacterium]|nr:alpha/beta fold hydrolase [Candidatus Limnocylindrales bacterium]